MSTVCALVALICFVLACFAVSSPVNLVALGLVFLAAWALLGSVPSGAWPWRRQ